MEKKFISIESFNGWDYVFTDQHGFTTSPSAIVVRGTNNVCIEYEKVFLRKNLTAFYNGLSEGVQLKKVVLYPIAGFLIIFTFDGKEITIKQQQFMLSFSIYNGVKNSE